MDLSLFLAADFASQTGYYAAAVIGMVALGALLYWRLRISKLNADLNAVLAVLESDVVPLNFMAYQDLKDKTQSLPRFKNVFDEFFESVITVPVKKPERVFNTEQSDVYFSERILVEEPLGTAFLEQAPGFFTGLGLLFTFVTLYIGMGHLKVVEGTGQVNGINVFIDNLSGKFVSSIAGLLSALIFSFGTHWQVGSLRAKCQEIQRKLNQLFSRKTTEAILVVMADSVRDQADTFNRFNTDLSETLKESVSSSLGPLMSELLLSINGLKSTTELIQQEKSQSSSQAVQDMMAQFEKALTAGATEEFANLGRVLRETTESLSALPAQMIDLTKSFSETLDQQRQQNESHFLRIKSQQDETTDKISIWTDSVRQQFDDLTLRLSDETKAFGHLSEKLFQWTSSLGEIGETFIAFGSKLNTTVEQLDNVGVELHNAARLSDGASQKISTSMDKMNDGLRTQEESVKSMQQAWQKQEQLFELLDTKLGSSLAVLNSAMDEYSKVTTRSLNSHLSEFDTSLTDACRKLGGTIDELREQLEELTVVFNSHQFKNRELELNVTG